MVLLLGMGTELKSECAVYSLTTPQKSAADIKLQKNKQNLFICVKNNAMKVDKTKREQLQY